MYQEPQARPLVPAGHWCPGEAADPRFANRSAAERLLGIDFLRKQESTRGWGVNVVVADQGLDRQVLGDRYGGGWSVGDRQPGSAQGQPGAPRSHGMMIAHNILQVAPDATLFDLPLAPVADIEAFLDRAVPAYETMLAEITKWRADERRGPWILVNPWGIHDRKSERRKGHYTEEGDHRLNQLVLQAVGDNIDVVFAAGNCGQFCPNDRCGDTDYGPGRSIWGANSLDAVLTVGAVRSDGIWLGYSSQGPGQEKLGAKKPDLCAASQFCENDDSFNINTGTSAACALAAGVIAALRSRWDPIKVPPPTLQRILNDTAMKPHGLNWQNKLGQRFGNGILNAEAAFKELLSHQFPS
jgi:Subtilase family